jgi:GTPase SAR1 family protein
MLSVDGEPDIVDFVDTAGQEDDQRPRYQFYRDSDAAMIIYNIAS